jgi:voltage-gated potassium channel
MPDRDRTDDPEETTATRGAAPAEAERSELLGHLQELVEPAMVGLGLAFLVLLAVDFAGAAETPAQRLWLDRALTAIWVAFVLDFAVRLVVAPAKGAFLRANWLAAASLALPFLRPLRVLRALRAARSLSLVRLLGGANRGMRVLQRVARGRQLAYVAGLTVMAALLGAVGVLYFDRDADGAPIRTFGDALWWSSALVTTINNEAYAVSPEARFIALLLRIFAVSVFGLITAAIASYFVGRQAEERAGAGTGDTVVGEGLADLRRENRLLRHEVAGLRLAVERLADGAERPTPLRVDTTQPPKHLPSRADDQVATEPAGQDQ